MSGTGAAAARQKQAKLLNDLARNGVEPPDPVVRQKYDEFKIDVTKQALKILKERIPAKILHFNEQVNVNSAPGDLLHLRDLMPCMPIVQPLPIVSDNLSSTIDTDVVSAKRPRVDIEKHISSGNDSVLVSNPETISRTIPNGEVVYSQYVPTHSQIVKMEESVGKDALELIEMVGTVKLWIQLNVPRIEDGNNFGVAIQEEAIQELGRVEDAAFNLCDGIKYHTARAKLVSKVLKYPNVADYTQSVLEIDRKEWLHLKVSMIDMRNSYSMLYDLLHKNWEKVVKPRAAENNLMVM